ncbi:MAG: peptidase domain-containing ABC transporter [Alphaproteobacteria bacterium]|nr:peptidase domain-containing ABC transporter [Alphaproteobacteria bacterium]
MSGVLDILSRKRRVRTVLQGEANECGLACLAMVANYHSHDISLSYLRSLFPLSLRGMTFGEIVRLADKLDLDAQGFAISKVKEVAELKCPAILHWNGNHIVVLEKVVRGVFYIHDPAFGVRRYSLEDVKQHFAGTALEFEPRVKFNAIKAAKKSRYWSVFKACRGIESTIAVVAVMSFGASLFALTTPVFLEVALDNVIPQYDVDLLLMITIGMALFTSYEAVARWLRDFVTLQSSTVFEIFFTRNVVGHAFRLPVRFFELRHPGDFLTRLASIDHIRTFLVTGFVSSVADGAMSLLTVVMMFYYSPTMAGVSVGVLIVALVVRVATYPKIAEYTTATLEARSEEQARLIDGLQSVATLKVHNTEELFCLKWFDNFTRFANAGFRTGKLTIDTDLLLHILFMVGTVVTLYIGVADVMKNEASVAKGGTTIGILYAFFALRGSFFNAMNALIMNLLQLSVMKAHFARLDDILDEAQETNIGRVGGERSIRSAVRIEDVNIQFDRGTKPLVEGINFQLNVAAHESIAIIGDSGCGKSSLLKVVSSLHAPFTGRVLVDELPLSAFGLHEYRANLGVVFPEDNLFSGTVVDNLTIFSQEVDGKRVEEALAMVDLLEEVHRLPQGLATLLSNESPILSTGQRRRLLLARAIVRQPRLLLLDEITANLDPQTEEKIVSALSRVPAAKVFVTHSERLLRYVNQIYHITEGRMVPVTYQRSKTAVLNPV